jgi:hypothetical protein
MMILFLCVLAKAQFPVTNANGTTFMCTVSGPCVKCQESEIDQSYCTLSYKEKIQCIGESAPEYRACSAQIDFAREFVLFSGFFVLLPNKDCEFDNMAGHFWISVPVLQETRILTNSVLK